MACLCCAINMLLIWLKNALWPIAAVWQSQSPAWPLFLLAISVRFWSSESENYENYTENQCYRSSRHQGKLDGNDWAAKRQAETSKQTSKQTTKASCLMVARATGNWQLATVATSRATRASNCGKFKSHQKVHHIPWPTVLCLFFVLFFLLPN